MNQKPDTDNDDDHFINDFLPKLPSGKYRTVLLGEGQLFVNQDFIPQ